MLKKRRLLLILFCLPLFLRYGVKAAGAEQAWDELKGKHFIVYHIDNKAFAGEALRESERYYYRIADELGYRRHSGFWTWDSRVGIYIYPERESFLKATGQPPWSHGMADYTNKRLVGYAWDRNFINGFLPHEIAHLVFRDYVGFKGEVPLWLDEGVAQWMEVEKRDKFKLALRELAKKGLLLPLERLTRMDVRSEPNEAAAHAFYIQSVSLVGFMMEEFGSKRFINFCRQLRDGKGLDEALAFSFSPSVKSMRDLEKKWNEYIKREVR